MKTLIIQAFARLPEHPESNWLAYTILALSGFAAGFFLGRWIEQRRAYSRGYLDGFRNGSTPPPLGDINCPPSVFANAPTIKISPRNAPPKSPFTVSKEGQLAQDMGWNKGGREIGNGNG